VIKIKNHFVALHILFLYYISNMLLISKSVNAVER